MRLLPGEHRGVPWNATSGERSGIEANWRRSVFIDWDKPAPPDYLRSRSAAKEILRGSVAVYLRESSGKGFHILVEFDRDLSVIDKFELRERLGDDPSRLKFDIHRYSTYEGKIIEGERGSKARTSGRPVFRADYVTGVVFDTKDFKAAGDWASIKGFSK